MGDILEKPAGSIIQQREESGGRVFFWQSLRSGPIYKSAVRDGVLFVCASIAGLVFIIYRLLVSPLGPSVPERLVFGAFMAMCYAAVIAAAYFMLRGPRAESVALGQDYFRHDPGGRPMALLTHSPYMLQESTLVAVRNDFFRRRRPVELPKANLPPVVLNRVGERQRLYFECGTKRIEIGRFLREPEREWLAAVIQAWQEE